MKKLLIKTIILFLMVLPLAGCGDNGDETVDATVTPTPVTSSKVVLIWWNLFEPLENVQPLIDAYQLANPNVEIQYEQKGIDSVDSYVSELDQALLANDPLRIPDIYPIHNTWGGKYENYINKAPETVVPISYLDDFYPVVKEDFVRGGGIVAMPIYMDALAVIYNKGKLQASGYTGGPDGDWSQFKRQAQALTNKDSKSYGFSAAAVENTEFYFDIVNLLFLQNGVKMLDETGKTATFASQPDSADAITFYNDFLNGSTPTWESSMKKDVGAFLDGNLAMYIAPSWRLVDILNYNARYNLGLDVGVGSIPQSGGDDKIFWANYWGQAVSKDTVNKDIAWDFLKFITSAEQASLLNSTVIEKGRPIGIIYPRMSMQDELITNPLLSPYVEALNYASTWNMGDGIRVKAAFTSASLDNQSLQSLETTVTNIITNPGLK